MVEFHRHKCKKDADGTKLKPVPSWQLLLKTIFGDSAFPGSAVTKRMARLDFFLEMFLRNELNLIITLTNVELRQKNPATTIW